MRRDARPRAGPNPPRAPAPTRWNRRGSLRRKPRPFDRSPARAPRSLLAALALLAAGAAAAPAPPGGAYKVAGMAEFLAGGYVADTKEPSIVTVVPAAGGVISHRLTADGLIVTNLTNQV